MIGFFSIVLGLIIVGISYKVLVKEIDKGFAMFSEKYPGIGDDNTKTILEQFDRMENLVNDLNTTYYSFISDLEGHYSVHDKELELLDGRLMKLEKDLRMVRSSLAADVKARQTNASPDDKKLEPRVAELSEGKKETLADPVHKNPVAPASISVSSTVSASEPSENSDSNRPAPMKIDLLNMDEQENEVLRKKIIDLRHKGLNLAQIARELELGVGELQLFLNLNKIR